MLITDVFRLPDIVDKLLDKHHVAVDEVEEMLSGDAHFRRVERGRGDMSTSERRRYGRTK